MLRQASKQTTLGVARRLRQIPSIYALTQALKKHSIKTTAQLCPVRVAPRRSLSNECSKGTPSGLSEAADEARREEVEAIVRELIEEKARPHAQLDGGDIVFRSMDHENGVVHVDMKGACASCASSTVTLRFMVLRLLSHYVEEVKDIEGHFPEEDDDAMMP